MSNFIKQISTATSGTITLADTKQDCQLVHDAVSLSVTLTITMPASPIDGQKVGITSTLGITTLTISSGLTIVGILTTLAAAGFATFMYESGTNKWYRIS